MSCAKSNDSNGSVMDAATTREVLLPMNYTGPIPKLTKAQVFGKDRTPLNFTREMLVDMFGENATFKNAAVKGPAQYNPNQNQTSCAPQANPELVNENVMQRNPPVNIKQEEKTSYAGQMPEIAPQIQQVQTPYAVQTQYAPQKGNVYDGKMYFTDSCLQQRNVQQPTSYANLNTQDPNNYVVEPVTPIVPRGYRAYMSKSCGGMIADVWNDQGSSPGLNMQTVHGVGPQRTGMHIEPVAAQPLPYMGVQAPVGAQVGHSGLQQNGYQMARAQPACGVVDAGIYNMRTMSKDEPVQYNVNYMNAGLNSQLAGSTMRQPNFSVNTGMINGQYCLPR